MAAGRPSGAGPGRWPGAGASLHDVVGDDPADDLTRHHNAARRSIAHAEKALTKLREDLRARADAAPTPTSPTETTSHAA
jgi:hypothetical protein